MRENQRGQAKRHIHKMKIGICRRPEALGNGMVAGKQLPKEGVARPSAPYIDFCRVILTSTPVDQSPLNLSRQSYSLVYTCPSTPSALLKT